MKSYKSSTTQKKMNLAGHEFLAWIVVLVTLDCLKGTTGSHAREPRSEILILKIAF